MRMITFGIFWLLAIVASVSLVIGVRVGPRLRELADHNSKLIGLLIMLEWSLQGSRCPLCGASRMVGHFHGCRYLEIFAKQKGYYYGQKKID